MKNRAEARIDLKAIQSNANNIKKHLSEGTEFLAVVKADAYGHGAKEVSSALAEIGVKHFAVATAEEALELRNNGLQGEILVLGKSDLSYAKKLIDNEITQSVESVDYARALASYGNVKVHIKIDTGMSRFGIYCHGADDVAQAFEKVKAISEVPQLEITGIFTHFATADEEDDSFTKKQFSAFKALCDKLKEAGVNCGRRHCCNSAGALKFKEMHLDMVRIGIALYGLELSVPGFPLIPAMSVVATLASVSKIEKNDTVSYGRTFKAGNSKAKGVVSFGYADGMPRLLSNKYSLSVNGKKAPILGRVCMDLMIIDLDGIEAKEGDEVVIFGKDNEVSLMADIIGTINYEIVCGITKRVPRVYS